MTRRNIFQALFGGAIAAIFGIPEIKLAAPPYSGPYAWRLGIMDDYSVEHRWLAPILSRSPIFKAPEFNWWERRVPPRIRALPKNNDRWL